MLFRYGFGHAWINQGVGNEECFLINFMNRVKDNWQQEWWGEVSNMSRLHLFCQIKHDVYLENYLLQVSVNKYRKALSQIRCSSHRLLIETGRSTGLERSERLCEFCDTFSIEDECHFLLECDLYHNLRTEFLPNWAIRNTNQRTLSKLFMSKDRKTICNLARFIYQAFQLRKEAIID